jgi:hypothetical protein
MRFVASLMPAKFSYYDRGVQLSQNQPIPQNFMQKQNHEIFAMRFVASLMPAKFSYYDRGVQLSKNQFRKIFCNNKITNFLPYASSLRSCLPSSPTATGEYSCRKTDSAKLFAKKKSRNFCHAFRGLAQMLMSAKFSYYHRGVELSQN